MAKDEKLGKWVEAMTPRHAIENFFDHATLVDSPNPEELYKSSPNSALTEIPESTPLAGSSQSSQRSGWKRKSDHEEQYHGNGSKRINAEEIEMSLSDSVSDTVAFPSKLESPHLVIPQKTELKIKKRMSVSAFTKAIQSQEPQESNVTINESSIASALGSPDDTLSHHPRRLENHTSVSDFAESLGKKVMKTIIKDDSSSMENASVLSHLDSPEHISYKKRGTGVEKKRASSTGFKSILNKRSLHKDNLSEDESTDHSITSSTMLTERHAKSPRMSLAFEPMPSIPLEVHSQIEKTPSKIRSDAPSSNSDSELYEGMPDLESPDDFSPPGSTIQVLNSKSSELLEVTKHSQISIREKNETIQSSPFVSQNEKSFTSGNVSNSTSDVPSVLGSPQEYKEYHRPGHMPSKKKVSATGFLATLSQTVNFQSRKSPNRLPTSKYSKRTSIGNASEKTDEDLRRNTPSPLLEQLGRVTRSSSQAFDITLVSPETSARKTRTLESNRSDSDDSARQLVNKNPTALVMEMDEMPQNSSQTSLIEDDFSPPGSTIQVINRKSSELLDVAKHSPISIREKNETNQSIPRVLQNEKSFASGSLSNSTSDVPSVLDSPQEYKEYLRPGHMPSKKKISSSGFLATVSQTVDFQSRKSPIRSFTSASERTSKGNDSEETGELLRRNTPSPLPEKLGRVTRSSSQAFDKTFVSPKTSARKTPTLKSKRRDTDESAHQLVNKSPTKSAMEMDEMPQNSRRNSKRSSKAAFKIIEHTQAEGSHSDKAVGIPLNVTPSKLTNEMRQGSSSSSRIANISSVTSNPSPKNIPHPELDDQVTKDSEDILPMQIKKSLSLFEIASPILAPVEARVSSASLSPKRRTRKSLNFSTPTIKDSTPATPATEDGLPPIDEVIEETPPTDLDSMEEDAFEDERPIGGIEKEVEAEDGHPTPKTVTRSSRELNQLSRKSNSMQMASTNRYPALKNSTIVAGGSAFAGVTLSMSPIVPDKQGAPLRVPPSPRPTTPESPKTVAQFSAKDKSTPPKNLPKISSHPSTPAPFARKRTRSLTQSPMYMNVMKSSMQKVIRNVKDQQLLVPTVASTSADKNVTTPKPLSSVKGLSLSNSKKGKSIALSAFDEVHESSDTEWEDMEENLKPKPACIKIAFEEIPDRSKDFVPFEERLMADPVFQAKVSRQRTKLAAQKAAEEAVAAAAKKTTYKRKQRDIKKKEEDNIASVATNKGNFRFYARAKVTKDALEVVHGLVGEWFDFTLRQIEKYCIDEGKASLDTWQDCYKVMKRQGLAKNYAEYAGLCHDLLMNDECEELLPTRPPPEYAEWKREAQKRNK